VVQGEKVAQGFESMVQHLHSKLPRTHIVIMAILPKVPHSDMQHEGLGLECCSIMAHVMSGSHVVATTLASNAAGGAAFSLRCKLVRLTLWRCVVLAGGGLAQQMLCSHRHSEQAAAAGHCRREPLALY
jgi:hypothetical protein